MNRHEKPVEVGAGAQHGHAEEWSAGEVEGFARFEIAEALHFGVERGGRELFEIDERKSEGEIWRNDLHRLAVFELDAGSHHVVAAGDIGDGALEDRDIKRSEQFPSHGDVAGGVAGRQLIDQPEAGLLQRERRDQIAAMVGRKR